MSRTGTPRSQTKKRVRAFARASTMLFLEIVDAFADLVFVIGTLVDLNDPANATILEPVGYMPILLGVWGCLALILAVLNIAVHLHILDMVSISCVKKDPHGKSRRLTVAGAFLDDLGGCALAISVGQIYGGNFTVFVSIEIGASLLYGMLKLLYYFLVGDAKGEDQETLSLFSKGDDGRIAPQGHRGAN